MSQSPAFPSFTGERSMRFPAPDVARGFMLLLIALANVTWWMPASSATKVSQSTVDQVWLLLRTGVVDQRAYPLFAALFGFGLMTMINRRVTMGMDQGAHPYWAADSARQLVRRRGWWMLLFGLAHAAIFAGDIIGTYALVAIVFAGWFSRKNYRAMGIVGAIVTVVSLFFVWVIAFATQWVDTLGMVAENSVGVQESLYAAGVFAPILGVLLWAFNTPLTAIASLVVPAAFIGARLADTTVLSHVTAHRGRLAATAACGLGVGLIASLPHGLHIAGFIGGPAPTWATPLNHLAGLVGACGWLALLALFAGDSRPDGQLTGMRQVLANVGQRSMTAYVSQSVLFLVIFGVANLSGIASRISVAIGALIALAVWLVTVVYCQWLAGQGRRGPLETLLRRVVAGSGQGNVVSGPLPAGPVPPSLPPMPGPSESDLSGFAPPSTERES